MSENQPQEQAVAPVLVNAQYIKDLSFEVPGAPAIFVEMQKGQPEISVQVNLNAEPLQDNIFEMTLHIHVKAELAGKVAFIAELSYAGVFTLNVEKEHIQPVLLIECPRLLFPFARNIIADVTRDGGFPPMLLQPIDFVQLYRQRIEELQTQGNA